LAIFTALVQIPKANRLLFLEIKALYFRQELAIPNTKSKQRLLFLEIKALLFSARTSY